MVARRRQRIVPKNALHYFAVVARLRRRANTKGKVKRATKKHVTCLATLLQNELNSDVACFTIPIKPFVVVNGFERGWLNARHLF